MLSVIRPIHFSNVRQAICATCAVPVCSYIFTEVLDLKAWNFFRFFRAVQESIAVGAVFPEAELNNSQKRLVFRQERVNSDHPPIGKLPFVAEFDASILLPSLVGSLSRLHDLARKGQSELVFTQRDFPIANSG